MVSRIKFLKMRNMQFFGRRSPEIRAMLKLSPLFPEMELIVTLTYLIAGNHCAVSVNKQRAVRVSLFDDQNHDP